MAMIRGRKLQSKTIEELERENARKALQDLHENPSKPAASLKEQRRLTAYDVTQHPVNEPIDDPDPYYSDKKTFIFLSKERMIFRFSEKKSLFLFGKHSRFRLAFLRVLVHQWFNYLVIGTIILNCGVMMVNGNNKPEWSEVYVENVFLFIYTVEAIVKIVGRGFLLHEFSYLRDPWNWLDFVVILAAFVLIFIDQLESTKDTDVGSLTFLRAVRVLRIFKTVSVIPGLRMIVSALIASTKALKDAMLLSLLGFSMFSLIGIQVFRGTLKFKCVLRPPWMLEGLTDCTRAVPLNNISGYDSCSLETMYGDEIRRTFGIWQYHEMLHLTDLWLKSNISVRGSTQSYPTEEPRGLTTMVLMAGDIDEMAMSGSGASGISETLFGAHSNWTYRIPSAHAFNATDYVFNWNEWIGDERHYLKNGFQPELCGNASGAKSCSDISLCVKAGHNPNFGYTSFDNFPYAFLSVFRLSLQDNWEELYLQVLETSGHLAVLFFLIMIFLGSYYLINLILAVVASSYEDQRKSVQLALAEEKRIKLTEKAFLKERMSKTRLSSISKHWKKDVGLKGSCLYCDKFKKIFLQWTCCVGDSIFCLARAKLKAIFTHPKAEMVVVGLVLLNTFFMAMEREPKGVEFEEFLSISNVVFNTLFTIEMVGKMLALSPHDYFSVTWNTFDFIVVTLSLMEMVLSDRLPDGLAVLRTFRLIRLVRILKLAKSWPTLSKIMSMIASSLSKLGYLTVVLLIVLVIFALAGMQTVGVPFYMDRTKCGEWIQSMWSCMHTVSISGRHELVPVCLLLFLGVVFVGNLVVLNLFLALLLNSFSGADLNGGSGNGGAKKFIQSLKSAKKSLSRTSFPRVRLRKAEKACSTRSSSSSFSNRSQDTTHEIISKNKNIKQEEQRMTTNNNANVDCRSLTLDSTGMAALRAEANIMAQESSNRVQKHKSKASSLSGAIQEFYNRPSDAAKDIQSKSGLIYLEVPKKPKTLSIHSVSTSSISSSLSNEASDKKDGSKTPNKDTKSEDGFNKKAGLCSAGHVQSSMNRIVSHWIFESFIIFCIMSSSITLVFEDVTLPKKPALKAVLEVLDKIFMTVFFLEMIMKWIGFGLKKYFRNGWCILDFFIVVVSLISLSLEIYALTSETNSANLSFLRVLRSLRAFRPLRAMSRFKGIKVVTDALFRSIPSILNVFAICVVFWLVFAIMGVNLFAGKMAACRWKDTGEKVWHPQDFKSWKNLSLHFERPPIEVTNKSQCEKLAEITNGKVYWRNLFVNFDNVGTAYISLMQVATFKGWMPIMYAAVDVPAKIGDQPIYENAVENYFFFVAFIIFGAFFSLNLFISVVIDNFNQQKSRFDYDGGQLFMTDSQRKAYDMMKKMTAQTPNKLMPVPRTTWRKKLYFFVTGDRFELSVMVATLLNLAVLAIEHEGINKELADGMEYVNYAFLIIFTIEITLRIVASGAGFFRIPWNVFDFLVIGSSVMVNVVSIAKMSIDGTSAIKSPWLPMLRMIRIARILRVARVASGIRTLLFALMLSLPALFNVGSLLFLFVFIYAIFGMSQFGNVEQKGAITDILNFRTFPNAFMLLFQMSTSAGWDGFLEPTLYTDESQGDCTIGDENTSGTCMGNSFVGYLFFTSYLILTFVIITNMYIAIILENFDLANKDSAEPLTVDDFEHYFDVWQKYDKDASGKLTIEQLSNLLHNVDRPLRIEKPNIDQIAQLEIPMDDTNRMHIMDVATAMIKRILGPYQFTEEMKCEVHAHFRKKAKRLMRNYSEHNRITSYDYAKDQLHITNLAHSILKEGRDNETAPIECTESNSSAKVSKNGNQNSAVDITVVLHMGHDDVRAASLLHSVALGGRGSREAEQLLKDTITRDRTSECSNFNSNSNTLAPNKGTKITQRKPASGFFHICRKILQRRLFSMNGSVPTVCTTGYSPEGTGQSGIFTSSSTQIFRQCDNLAFVRDEVSLPGRCNYEAELAMPSLVSEVQNDISNITHSL